MCVSINCFIRCLIACSYTVGLYVFKMDAKYRFMCGYE